MILIGIGSNLPAPGLATPRDTAAAALAELPRVGVGVTARSGWYASEPVPASDQPWFVNAVAAVETALDPEMLLAALLGLEARFARHRSLPNAARTLDLDLLDYNGQRWDTDRLILPHPRSHERRFVLEPLCEIAPHWRPAEHGLTAAELLQRLPPGQVVQRMSD